MDARDGTSKLPGDSAHLGRDYAALKFFIFPIVKSQNHQIKLVGTGFFVASFGVIATARHVIEDVLDEKNAQRNALMVIHLIPPDRLVPRPITRAAYHKRGDVALCLLANYRDENTGHLLANPALSLTTRIPLPGEGVVTYAYPNTVVEDTHLISAPSLYAGNVIEFYPTGRDRLMMPRACYRTSIVIHGGASGGPVFAETGGVIGINSTGFGIEPESFVSSIHDLLSLSFPQGSIEGVNFSSEVNILALARRGPCSRCRYVTRYNAVAA